MCIMNGYDDLIFKNQDWYGVPHLTVHPDKLGWHQSNIKNVDLTDVVQWP